jgi:hypothetical protein
MNSLFEKLPIELSIEVYSYLSPRYKLLKWVYENREKMDIPAMCQFPKSMDFIFDVFDVFESGTIPQDCWKFIFRNNSAKAIKLIENNNTFFYIEELYELYANPFYVDIIEQKLKNDKEDQDESIVWFQLAKNPEPRALDIIKKDIEGEYKEYSCSALRWFCNCEDADDEIGCVCNEYQCWSALCCNTNPDAISLIEKNLDKLKDNCWENLSGNPAAVSLLEKNLDKLDDWCWEEMCSNPCAIHILKDNIDKVDWHILSGNVEAVPILQENLEKIDWSVISSNPGAISILEKNTDKIDWDEISLNPSAISLIQDRIENGEYINWSNLSKNVNAIKILERNIDKIDWKMLSLNTSIFEEDRKRMFEDIFNKNK